jgi:hypothetical protein
MMRWFLALWLLAAASVAQAACPSSPATTAGGYCVAGTTTQVQATWRVPATPKAPGATLGGQLLIWVGIGNGASNLVQMGTLQNDSNGSAPSAWYEFLPASLVTINQPVAVGDVVTATISCTANCVAGQSATFLLTMVDATQGWTFSQSFSYTSQLDLAQWTLESNAASIPNFGTVPFVGLQVNGSGAGLVSGNAFKENNSDGETVNPSAPGSDSASFNACWGTPGGTYTTCPISGSGTTALANGGGIGRF